MAESKSISMMLKINTIANLAGFKNLRASLGVLSNQVNLAKVNLLKLAGAGAAVALGFEGIKKVGDFMKGMKVEAEAARAAEEKLGVALKRRSDMMKVTGGDMSAVVKDLSAWADAMEKVGVTAATSLKAGFAGLTAAGMEPERIKQVSAGFEGMVVGLKGIGASASDVESVSIAIRNFIKGAAPLPREFRKITDAADLAKIAEPKKMSEVQRAAAIMEIMAKQTNRVGLALETTAGKQFVAEQNWRRLQEILGKPFLDTQVAFSEAMGSLGAALEPVAQLLADIMTPAMKGFAVWIKDMTPHMHTFTNELKLFAEGLIGVFAGTHEVNWDWITAGLEKLDIGKMASELRENIGKGLQLALTGLTQLGTWINDAIRMVDWKQVGTVTGQLLVEGLKGLADIGKVIANFIVDTDWSHVIFTVGDVVSDLIIGVVSGLGGAIASAINWEEHLQPKLMELLAEVGTWPGKVGAALSGLGAALMNAWKVAVDAVIAAASGWGQAILDAMLSLLPGPVRGVVKGMLGSGGGGEKVPGKQLGGLVTHPMLAALAEKGPEVVVPMQRTARNRGILAQAAEGLGIRGMMGGGGEQNITMNVPITVNGVADGHEREVGREIQRALQDPIKQMLDQLKKARDEERRLAYV